MGVMCKGFLKSFEKTEMMRVPVSFFKKTKATMRINTPFFQVFFEGRERC